MTQEHIVIIGNGIAGVTAARHIRKLSDKKVTIISSESEYFFSRTALMYVYMGHMKWQHLKPYEDYFWRKNNFNLVQDHVIDIFPEQHQIELRSKRKIHFDQLIIATGSKPNKFGWPGENAKGVQGLYSKQDLELLEKNAPDNKTCRRAVIVGGGL
ncbi:MAG: FAD-dependent oxidoreductase, partial [Psychroflexus salarius]